MYQYRRLYRYTQVEIDDYLLWEIKLFRKYSLDIKNNTYTVTISGNGELNEIQKFNCSRVELYNGEISFYKVVPYCEANMHRSAYGLLLKKVYKSQLPEDVINNIGQFSDMEILFKKYPLHTKYMLNKIVMKLKPPFFEHNEEYINGIFYPKIDVDVLCGNWVVHLSPDTVTAVPINSKFTKRLLQRNCRFMFKTHNECLGLIKYIKEVNLTQISKHLNRITKKNKDKDKEKSNRRQLKIQQKRNNRVERRGHRRSYR